MAKIIKNCKVRMDFEIEEIPSENGKTTRKVIFKPNEKRYELREYDGKQGYFDKIDNIFIPHDLLLESLNSKENMPIYAPPSRIENLIEYFEERYSKLDKYYTQTIRTTDNQEFLKSNIGSTKEFVFMSIDIVNSTDRSKKMGIETNTKTNLMFLNEINRILIRFDGHVMKYLGDGLIAYFTTPNIVGKVDNSLDCSSAIKYFTENYINRFLIEIGFSSQLTVSEAVYDRIDRHTLLTERALVRFVRSIFRHVIGMECGSDLESVHLIHGTEDRAGAADVGAVILDAGCDRTE